jgi:tetratricopeptide (TPR) repeat protein
VVTGTAGTRVDILKTILGGICITAVLSACAGTSQSSERDALPKAFQDAGGTVEKTPTSAIGQYLAGRQAMRDQNADIASKYFADALTEDAQDIVLLTAAFQAALGMGDVETAIGLAHILVKEEGDNSAAYLVLALDALRQNDFALAREYLKQTGDTGFNVLVKPLVMSWIELGAGDVNKAIAELDALDKLDGFDTLKKYHVAMLADVSGQRELADEAYEQAVNGPAGQAVRLIQAYGLYLARTGREQQARVLFEEYLVKYPLSPTISLLLEDMDTGRSLKPLLNTPVDGAAEALYSAASVIGRERAVGIAATYTYFTLMLKPDFPVARVLLAEAAEDRGRWEEALNLYSQIDKNSAYYKNARTRQAWATYKLGDQDEASRILEEIVSAYPDDIEALVVLADMNRDVENWNEAARQYGRAVSRIPNYENRHWSLFYARGIAYEQSKQWALAETDLLKALELRPDHPQVLNYLAYSWVDRDENLDKAKDMLIKAVSLRPRDGYIIDSLGWLYYRLGDYEDAIIQLEKAVSLQAADPTINDHLGDAYWRVGRTDEARYQWQRALWLDPTSEQIQNIEVKLKNGLPNKIKAEK